MSQFILTAQLNLQAPGNVAQVRTQIQNQLNGINVNVAVQNGPAAARQIAQVNRAATQLDNTGVRIGRTFGLAIRRFAAFSIATRSVSLFASRLSSAVDEAIKFQRELVKISQVTGKTTRELGFLVDKITTLSTTLGTSSQDLLSTSRILAQAGIQAADLEVALSTLAKTTLAPTFEDISKTAEGAVAILSQFQQGVGGLEAQLGAINAVAGKFAVESGDLIAAVRRTGGVFKSAGGNLNDLIGLFTSVRATTRESAESIATGLRTIFTRIQRPKTIEFLKQYGVELTDLEGKFVGPFDAIRKLSGALSGFEEGDIRFVKIAEELGGFRQIGKVLPLLQQFEVAERARQAAIEGGTSLTKDAVTAQEALAVQIIKVKEEFFALIRGVSETATFQVLVKTTLSLASAFIKVAESIKPIIPLITAFAGIKLAKSIGPAISGVAAGLGRSAGGPIRMARGGVVPGSGNRDTVPALLSPGEFVIRKSSVDSIGAGTLGSMNKYADGGTVKVKNPFRYGAMIVRGDSGEIANTPVSISDKASQSINKALVLNKETVSTAKIEPLNKTQFFKTTKGSRGSKLPAKGDVRNNLEKAFKESYPNEKVTDAKLNKFGGFEKSKAGRPRGLEKTYQIQGPFPLMAVGSRDSIKTELDKEFSNASKLAIEKSSQAILDSGFAESISTGPIQFKDGQNFKLDDVLKGAAPAIEGYILEAVLGSLGDLEINTDTGTGVRADFDFPKVTGLAKKKLAKLFDPNASLFALQKADAKISSGAAKSGEGKLVNKIAKDLKKKSDFTLIPPATKKAPASRKALGGSMGGSTDTVPALLTPGEFVFNKKAASRIGGANLNRMNRKGFAAGGPVGRIQKFQGGGEAGGGGAKALAGLFALQALPGVIEQFTGSTDNAEKSLSELESAGFSFGKTLTSLITSLTGAALAASAFGISLNKDTLTKFKSFTATIEKSGESFNRTLAAGAARVNDVRSGRSRSASKQRAQLRKRKEGLSPSVFTESIDADIRRSRRRSKGARRLGGKSRLGRFGGGLRVAQLGGGTTSRRGATKIASGLTSLVPKLAKFGSGLVRLGTPLGLGAVALGVFSSALKSGFGFQEKYNQALKEGNVAKAEEYAVLNQLSGLGQLFGQITGLTDGIVSLKASFGGPTLDSVKSLAKAQVLSAKASRDQAKNASAAAEALKDAEGGFTSFADAFASGKLTSNLNNYNDALEAAEKANLDAEKNKSGTGTFTGRNIATIGGLFGETSGEKNRRIDEEKEKRTQEATDNVNKAFDTLRPSINKLSRETILMGGSFETVKNTLDFTPTAEQLEKLEKSYNQQKTAVDDNIKALKALNFGLSPLKSVTAGLSLQFEALSAISNGTFNELEFAGKTLEAALTGADVSSADFDKALKKTSQTLKGFGTSDTQISKLKKTFTTLNTAINGAEIALQKVKGSGISAGNPEEAKQELIKQLGNIFPEDNKEARNIVRNAFANFDFSKGDIEQVLSGNLESVLKKIQDKGGEAFKDLAPVIDELVNAEKTLLSFKQKTFEAERNFIAARVQGISLEKEAAQAISDFGGKLIKTSDKLEFARRSLSTQLRGGVGAGGTAAGVSARLSSNSRRAAEIASSTNAGPEERQELEKLQQEDKALVDFTRTKLKLVKEEIEIAKKKNALDKSAVESLLKGDIAGFLEKEEAAGAASALRSGDANALKLFSQEAIGTAFGSLTDQEKRAAGPIAGLSTFQTQAVTEQTPEIAALEKEGIQYANLLNVSSSGVVSLGEAALKSAKALLGEAEARLKSTKIESNVKVAEIQKQQKITERQAQEKAQANAEEIRLTNEANARAATEHQKAQKRGTRSLGGGAGSEFGRDRPFLEFMNNIGNISSLFSRGGTVYANNGMFIPRGTDTVPAMLTPGEFIVNRAAVQRGNNLQLLRSINGGDRSSNGAPMASGGTVRYYQEGGFVDGISKMFGNIGSSLTKNFSDFAATVDKLVGMKLDVKLDPTNVNVNFNGPILSELTAEVKKEVFKQVIDKLQLNQLGKLEEKQ